MAVLGRRNKPNNYAAEGGFTLRERACGTPLAKHVVPEPVIDRFLEFLQLDWRPEIHLEEQKQRANVLPPSWIWVSSGKKMPFFLKIVNDTEGTSENFDTEYTALLERRKFSLHYFNNDFRRATDRNPVFFSGFFTIAIPTDHNGEYNPIASTCGGEVVIVAPPEYYLRDRVPVPSKGESIFKEGEFIIVAEEDVQIHDAKRGELKWTRLYAVPKGYEDEYYKLLGRNDTSIIHSERHVDLTRTK